MMTRWLLLLFIALFQSQLMAVAPEKGPDRPQMLGIGIPIRDAIAIRITPRGQKIFSSNFDETLRYIGAFDPSYFYLKSNHFKSQKPIELSDEALDIFKTLNLWMPQLKLSRPRPSIQVNEVEAQFDFTKFGLSFSAPPRLPGEFAESQQRVVMTTNLSVSNFIFDIERIEYQDLDNNDFGVYALNHFRLNKSSPKNLNISLPVEIHVDPKNAGMRLFMYPVANNLDDVNMKYSFTGTQDHRVEIPPRTGVLINGKEIPLESGAIANDLIRHQDRLLTAIRKQVVIFIKDKLPQMVNNILQEKVFKKLAEVNDMKFFASNLKHNGKIYHVTPPEKNLIKLRFQLESFYSDDQGSLVAQVSATARDPESRFQSPLPVDAMSLKAPPLNDAGFAGQYDLVASLNQGLINRILDLNAQRGFFQNVPVGKATDKPKGLFDRFKDNDESAPASFVTLRGAPVARFDQSQPDRIKVHVELQPELSFIQRIGVLEGTYVGIDFFLKIAMTDEGVRLVADHVSEKFELNDQFIRAHVLKSTVHSLILKKIKEVNDDIKKDPPSFPLPIPTAFVGIPVDIKAFKIMPEGYLNIYYQFGVNK